MEVFHSFEEMHNCPRSVIALGTFDGVHLGHQMVMAKAREIAQDMNASSAVVTFAAHPLSILCPEKEPLRLATVKQKIRYIADQGIDILVLLAMTKELINESPEDFCRQLLRYVHPCAIVVGSNFTYGAKARGNTDTLKQFMQTQGIPVHVLTLLDRPGRDTPISSTVIRKLITLGHMETASALLGRPYELEETVVQGDRRGNTIGFPTANMLIPVHMALPPDGVYATNVCIDGQWYPAMTNIGDNPTFTNQYRRIETNIIGWQGNLYDMVVRLRFYKRIRHEITFASTVALQKQMEQDRNDTLAYFA